MSDISQIAIEPEIIVDFLKSDLKLKEIWQKILFQRVIDEAAKQREIIVTNEEIQLEANRQRLERRLEKASDTLAWLTEQLISPEDWENGIRNQLLSKKLSAELFSKRVEQFYAQNRLDFEQIVFYQIIVANQYLAQEICYQIEEGEISFYEAAHLYDIDDKRRQQCGYEGKFYRFNLKPSLAATLFMASPKKVIGPIGSEQVYNIFMVEEFISAELTPEKHDEVLNQMFEEWLTAELNYLLHTS